MMAAISVRWASEKFPAMLADDRGFGVGGFDVFHLISSAEFDFVSGDEGSRLASSTGRHSVEEPA